ncbi:MAG: 1-acyl-sn-glycerol-3-phosphate acyltransferase [Verrucomicrobiota bacterium]
MDRAEERNETPTTGLGSWPTRVVRTLGLAIIHFFYRIRSVQTEHFPKQGGVLLLPNHISWADAFFLTAACPRPVRFVMEGSFMKNPLIRGFCKLFNTVPITTGKPREALKIAADAIRKGDVVCIFPEGQLSRTGTLQELKRGCELIARLAGCPSVAVWSDGPWGSIFSFEGNRYFTKWPHRLPYRMHFAFAPPLAPDEVSLEKIREVLLETSTAALNDRITHSRWPEDRQRDWINGYQLGQINALPRRRSFSILANDPELIRLGALEGFAGLYRAKAEPDSDHEHWLGGDRLREHLETQTEPTGSRYFFDFGDMADEPFSKNGWQHLPCLAIDGIIVSMSAPDPPKAHSSSPKQPGSREGSRGMLLPGFYPRAGKDGTFVIHGPAAGEEGIALPEGSRIDADGFIFLPCRTSPSSSELARPDP